MAYEKEVPRWEGETAEPPESKKDEGYLAGDKPPAKWENWLRKGTYEAIKELQEKSVLKEDLENIEVSVTSVNSQTGEVVLNAADVGAETPTGAQAKVNALAGEGNTKTVKQLDDEAKAHLADILNKTDVTKGATLIGMKPITGLTGDNVRAAIQNLFQFANDGKTVVADAVTAKGVEVSPSDTFSTLANKIGQIVTDSSGDATAIAGDILSGKTAYAKGNKLTGTMSNRGAVTNTITTQGGWYTIPQGYHSGSGKIAASFPNLTSGNIKKGIRVGGVVGNYDGPIKHYSGKVFIDTAKTEYTVNVGFNPKYIAVYKPTSADAVAIYSDGTYIEGFENKGRYVRSFTKTSTGCKVAFEHHNEYFYVIALG